MRIDNSNRVWINYELGLSFEDVQNSVEGVAPSNQVYEDITKLTVYKNVYKQEIITEIFFDENKLAFLFDPSFDHKISTRLGIMYGHYIAHFASENDNNPQFTYDHLILAVTDDIKEVIENTEADLD